MAKSKRQMTQAKRAREQALRDRRQRKIEKKQARADAAAMQPAEGPSIDELDTLDEPEPESP
jgi:hypothetical protein